MLSLQFIREHPDLVKDAVAQRRDTAPIDDILALDEERRRLIGEADDLKRERNQGSQRIGRGQVRGAERDELRAHLSGIGERVRAVDDRLAEIDGALHALLLQVPNIPDTSVPVGATEADNVEVKVWGEKRHFDFTPKPHDELGAALGILDVGDAVKMSGSRFYALRGAGARLSRALAAYMLDMHVQRHGFEELYVPYIVKSEAMVIAAQLPKFADDAYALPTEDMYLIPTGEVPLVNMRAEDIVEAADLPIKYVALTPCFRREAGAAGRDTRGMIRVHQFDKVEMVLFVEPEASMQALEDVLGYAEDVLQGLELPYHVLEMNTSDLGFGQIKKYDLEVWMPGQDRYVEISSCSNMGDFQARRGRIRYRTADGKTRLVHTLNASGLAVGRTLAVVLENGQQADGSVRLPPALVPYMGGQTELRPPG